MKSPASVRALCCALFLTVAASSRADDNTKTILNATYDPASRVITLTGNKLAPKNNKQPAVDFNDVTVTATYNATTGKVLATLPAAPAPGTRF